MPRNGSGTMSVANSFSSGTTISSSAMNANFSDVASEITGSLPRDGQAAMTGQLKAATGTASAPGITFGADTDTGFYRKAGNTVGVVAGGSEVATIGESGLVDANSVVISGIPTGCMMMYGATTAPTGWVRVNGRTIGNASSGATERANADTSSLFSFLWTNYSDSVCAVSGGRGASASADYAANKTIALPDVRGRAFFGLDDMGNSAAARLGTAISNVTTNGSSGGSEVMTIAQANLPNVTLTGTTAGGGGHSHTVGFLTVTRATGSPAANAMADPEDFSTSADDTLTTSTASDHTHTFTTSSLNGNVTQTPTYNLPPAFLTTFIIKL